jgi:hypothetical protein
LRGDHSAKKHVTNYVKRSTGRYWDGEVAALIDVCGDLQREYANASPHGPVYVPRRRTYTKAAHLQWRTRMLKKLENGKTSRKRRRKPATGIAAKATRSGTRLKGS